MITVLASLLPLFPSFTPTEDALPRLKTLTVPMTMRYRLVVQDLRSEAARAESVKRSAAAVKRSDAQPETLLQSPSRTHRYEITYSTDGRRSLFVQRDLDAKTGPLVGRAPGRIVVLFEQGKGVVVQQDGTDAFLYGGPPAKYLFNLYLPGASLPGYPLVQPIQDKTGLEALLSREAFRKRLPQGSVPCQVPELYADGENLPFMYRPGSAKFGTFNGTPVVREMTTMFPGLTTQSWRFDGYGPEAGVLLAHRVQGTVYGEQTLAAEPFSAALKEGRPLPSNPRDETYEYTLLSFKKRSLSTSEFEVRSHLKPGAVVTDMRGGTPVNFRHDPDREIVAQADEAKRRAEARSRGDNRK